MTSSSSIKQAVLHYWDAIADSYDDRPGHDVRSPRLRERWQAMLLSAAGPATGPLDVLDVGCGTGFLSLLFAWAGHRVTGVDASAAMLARARAKARQSGVTLGLYRGDADALAVPDAATDVLCERHVLWTMPEPATSLLEWHRVLRPGGRLLLVEGDWRDRLSDRELRGEDPGFLHGYRRLQDDLPLYGGRPSGEVRALALDAGFVDAHVTALDERELWEGLDPARPAPRYLVRALRPR